MSIKKTRLVLLLASLILCLASFLPAVAVQAEDTFKVNAKAAFAVDACFFYGHIRSPCI